MVGNRSEVDITSFWLGDHWELDSPLTRNLAEVARDLRYRSVAELRAAQRQRQRRDLLVTAAPA
jgi:hypothetical protein